MGVNLLAGTFFTQERASDYLESVIINETFMESLGWENWEGKVIRYDSNNYRVIGLVQDFHYHSFYTKIYPAFFKPVKEEDLRYIVAGINYGKAATIDGYVEGLAGRRPPRPPAACPHHTFLHAGPR